MLLYVYPHYISRKSIYSIIYRQAKKETVFRLSLWWARRDLKPSTNTWNAKHLHRVPPLENTKSRPSADRDTQTHTRNAYVKTERQHLLKSSLEVSVASLILLNTHHEMHTMFPIINHKHRKVKTNLSRRMPMTSVLP